MRAELEIRRWLGCGFALLDSGVIEFRPDHYSGCGLNEVSSNVEYIFFTLFFLPLFPVGCKRVVLKTYDLRTGVPTQYIQKKEIIGDERMKVGELVIIYLVYWFVPVLIFVLIVTSSSLSA